jgi:hypothetical protein
MVDSKVKPANDVAWYTKSPEQVINAANISWLNALGAPLNVWNSTSAKPSALTIDTSGAPGVMRCGYVPTFGNPQDLHDPINIAAHKSYAYIRYYNSGSKNYDAPDLMKYFAVMDSAYAYAGFLARIYGLVNAYSSVNRYWPRAIFAAMGVDYETVLENIADFRTYINNYVAKVNAFAVPNNLPIFARHYWMCANVYKDSDSLWSQVYVNVPEVYAIYSYETADVEFYKLTEQSLESYVVEDAQFSKLTVEDLKNIGNTIVDSILYNQDFNIMSGDIIKAFGTNLFSVAGVPADAILYPVYDAGVLNQIMNANALGWLVTPTKNSSLALEIPQLRAHDASLPDGYVYSLHENRDLNSLQLCYGRNTTFTNEMQSLYFAIPYTFTHNMVTGIDNSAVILNSLNENPSPEETMESTRLCATTHPVNASTMPQPALIGPNTQNYSHSFHVLEHCGADVYTTFQIFTMNMRTNTTDCTAPMCSVLTLSDSTDLATTGGMLTAIKSLVDSFVKFESFDWHPILRVVIPTEVPIAGDNFYIPLPFVDLHRSAVVTREVLANIHEVANLSLFDISIINSLK